MNVVQRLQKMLCERLGICVPQEEIAVESVQLYADEMDIAKDTDSFIFNNFLEGISTFL